jgi:oxazoline/thiazoline synthase
MNDTYYRSGGLRYAKGKEDMLYLLGEHERHVLTGAAPAILFPEIDGIRTDEEIVAAVSTRLSAAEAYYGLLELVGKGFIQRGETRQDMADLAWWQHTGVRIDRLYEIFSRVFISIRGESDEIKRLLTQAFLQVGFRFDRRPAAQSVEVLVCDDYCDPSVKARVDEAASRESICYPIKLVGRTIWLGPIFRPKQLPCWTCLQKQLERNHPVENFLSKKRIDVQPAANPTDISLVTSHLATNIVALGLVRHLIEDDPGDGSITLETFDLWSMKAERHAVRVIPSCATCGDPAVFAKRVSRPVALSESPIKYTRDGGYRSCTPEETWEKQKRLVSPITGVIASIGPLKRNNHPLRPVYGASYFVHPPVEEVTASESFTNHSFGKGHTPAQARASALCEAIERYCAMYQGDEPVVRGTYHELRDRAVDPRDLLNLSETQYRERDKWERLCPRHPIPLPFNPSMTINWTLAWSLTHERQCLLPLSYCYSYVPTESKEKVCPHNPNGHAAGNTREEAILQAFLELVERDAVAIWWYNRLSLPEIELASFDDAYFVQVKRHYADLGWDLWTLDLTHDLGIPVCAALARNHTTKGYVIGFGSHLDMRLAVQRAITELHQLFDPNANQKSPWTEDDIEQPEFLKPNYSVTARRYSDYPRPAQRSIRDDIVFCVNKASSMGLETIVLDYSRPEIDLATVKVVVPGLRHFWPRLGPGRLYEVPVKIGWLERPVGESELNPKPLVL